ncbi:unnamed protein product [Colias eurytheme]|nr:unnamed protein product [Colias eurytheme]
MNVCVVFFVCLFATVIGSRVILVENAPTCFRRVLAGRRALRSHVRRVVDCERLEDCRRECATERRFHCESFNYRLDPTFRGKGLCELMTKPIEAFDIRHDFVDDKDYDFYELDRNSLEPNCPETLRGPGLLHSGFLSSKPKGSERVDWHEAGYRGYNRYDEKQHYTQHKRYEDQFYVPYQIGISRSDEKETSRPYNHYSHHDSHYKNQNHKSYSHWGLADTKYYGVKHGTNTDFDYQSLGKGHFDYQSLGKGQDQGYGYGWKKGRWNSSGESWSRWDEIGRIDDGDEVKDCSSRRSAGMSLAAGAVRRSLSARSVLDCEAACFAEREFKCVSYSYKYSSPSSDNCFLSERPYKALQMSADTGSDVYAMPQHSGCHTVSTKPWVESECFWHVRSGSAISGSAAKAALTVSGLGACEAECIRAHTFFCRGFSFRFEAPTIGDDLANCILTSSPPTSLDPGGVGGVGGGLHAAPHELYARGNYGRGCEPALYDDVQHKDAQCYLQYDNSAKLTHSAVRGQARVRDDRACGKACTDAPFRCLSFSFTANAPPDTDNCLLSEIRLFDLQRGVDYIPSSDDLLFAFDLFNGQCWRKVYGQHEVPNFEIPHPLNPTIEEHYPGTRPDPPSETYITGPSGPSYPSGPSKPIESGYKPIYEPIPSYIPDSGPSGPNKPSYGPSYLPDSGPSGPISGSKPSYGPSYLPDSGPSGPTGPYVPSSYEPSGPLRPEHEPVRPIRPDIGPIRPIGPTGPIDTGPKPYPDFDYKPSYKPVPEPYKPIRKPYKPYEPGFRPGYETKPGYLPEKPSYRPIERPYVKPSRPNLVGGSDELIPSSSWRHYTVSGFPCRRGTTCEQNRVAGHWACEPEGGEIGSWDYCCAPTHRCGYSEGFRKPWCYVGPSDEQWRPCSEKYYPYHQHNVPHPSLGHREAIRPRPDGQPNKPTDRVRPGPYLPEGDRKYWDDLYKNGPQAYYDKYGNPLPGYTRVPTESRPHIKYERNPPRRGSGNWVPVHYDDEPQAAGLGVPRYWPIAYLHKEPPPNTTYFRFNETTPTTERYNFRSTTLQPDTRTDRPTNELNMESRSIEDHHRNEKRRNISQIDEIDLYDNYNITTTTYKPESTTTETTSTTEAEFKNNTEFESSKVNENLDDYEQIKGLDDKLHDFTRSIEVFDIEDANSSEKSADLKTLEAEEKQIEAIGRLLASKRGGKRILDTQKQDLESKKVAVDNDFMDFNFKNRFPTERRGIIQRVTKEELKDVLNEGSLEVSETTFVRPPRILSTTENIKKAIVNGKVFYDATIRDRKDLFTNTTRKGKSLRLEERVPMVITNSNAKKNIRRNVNPIRRVKRVYRKRYNPEEVRKRLLEREKSKKD